MSLHNENCKKNIIESVESNRIQFYPNVLQKLYAIS